MCPFIIKIFKICADQSNQMILLEDADLYAVINYLRVKESIFSYLYEIWVQECRKQKFLWLVEEYLKNFSSHICVFRSTKELLTACSHSKMQIVSIWSEDIIAAKNLARSLNVYHLNYGLHTVLFIEIFLSIINRFCF